MAASRSDLSLMARECNLYCIVLVTGRTSAQAPGELELLRAFANTLRLAGPVDEIADPAALGRWLAARDLVGARVRPSDRDVARAAAFRRTVRGLLAANAGLGEAAGSVTEFNAALDWVGAAPRLLSVRHTGIAAGGDGLRGAVGRLAGILLDAVNSGAFGRLKLCATADCRLAFYDHGRNAAGRWCDMASCGNRAKVAAHRARRREAAAPEPARSADELLARAALRPPRRPGG
jgi:predicted RNA-binding Zn ribbon-like protein